MKYQQAVDLVADLFRDIERKVSGLPYIVHLFGVAHIVNKNTDNEDIIIAALLHDVLEDIPPEKYSEVNMRYDFGDYITDIVKTISHDEVKYSKLESRHRYLEQLESGSVEASLVSAADLLHNATDIVNWYSKRPDDIKKMFGDGAELRSWFWELRYQVFVSKLGRDHDLVRQLRPVLDEMATVNRSMM